MKTSLSPEDIDRVRDDIIRMQGWIHANEPNSTDPKIQRLVADLSRTRASIESLIV